MGKNKPEKLSRIEESRRKQKEKNKQKNQKYNEKNREKRAAAAREKLPRPQGIMDKLKIQLTETKM